MSRTPIHTEESSDGTSEITIYLNDSGRYTALVDADGEGYWTLYGTSKDEVLNEARRITGVPGPD